MIQIKKISETIMSHLRRMWPIYVDLVVLFVCLEVFKFNGVLWFALYIVLQTIVIYWLNREMINQVYVTLCRQIELLVFGEIQEKEFMRKHNGKQSIHKGEGKRDRCGNALEVKEA